jgi:hypothetical protein
MDPELGVRAGFYEDTQKLVAELERLGASR